MFDYKLLELDYLELCCQSTSCHRVSLLQKVSRESYICKNYYCNYTSVIPRLELLVVLSKVYTNIILKYGKLRFTTKFLLQLTKYQQVTYCLTWLKESHYFDWWKYSQSNRKYCVMYLGSLDSLQIVWKVNTALSWGIVDCEII